MSDIFAVVDTNGLKFAQSITESDELTNAGAGFVFNYGPVTIPLGSGENATGAPSDTLTISAFTITAFSDFLDTSTSELGPESLRWAIGISATSDVPEPSTWAMMVLGFAGLAFIGYRASRRSAALA